MSGPGGFRGNGFGHRGNNRHGHAGPNSAGGPGMDRRVDCSGSIPGGAPGYIPRGRGPVRGPCNNFNPARRPPVMNVRPTENWSPRNNSPVFALWRGPRPPRYNGPPRPFCPRGAQGNYVSRYPFSPGTNYRPPLVPLPIPDAKPTIPHLGSEEERKQKITEAADALKRKLSAVAKEPDNWRDDDDDDDDDGGGRVGVAESSRVANKGIPELKHDPPELNLTIGDLRDIGRVDNDHKIEQTKINTINDDDIIIDESEVKILSHNLVKSTIEMDLTSDDNHVDRPNDDDNIVTSPNDTESKKRGNVTLIEKLVDATSRNSPVDDNVATSSIDDCSSLENDEKRQPTNETDFEFDRRKFEFEGQTNEQSFDEKLDNPKNIDPIDSNVDKFVCDDVYSSNVENSQTQIVDEEIGVDISEDTTRINGDRDERRETIDEIGNKILSDVARRETTNPNDNSNVNDEDTTLTETELLDDDSNKTNIAKIVEQTDERRSNEISRLNGGVTDPTIVDVIDSSSAIETATIDAEETESASKSTIVNHENSNVRRSEIFSTTNDLSSTSTRDRSEDRRKKIVEQSTIPENATTEKLFSRHCDEIETIVSRRDATTTRINETSSGDRRDDKEIRKMTNVKPDEISKSVCNVDRNEKSRDLDRRGKIVKTDFSTKNREKNNDSRHYNDTETNVNASTSNFEIASTIANTDRERFESSKRHSRIIPNPHVNSSTMRNGSCDTSSPDTSMNFDRRGSAQNLFPTNNNRGLMPLNAMIYNPNEPPPKFIPDDKNVRDRVALPPPIFDHRSSPRDGTGLTISHDYGIPPNYASRAPPIYPTIVPPVVPPIVPPVVPPIVPPVVQPIVQPMNYVSPIPMVDPYSSIMSMTSLPPPVPIIAPTDITVPPPSFVEPPGSPSYLTMNNSDMDDGLEDMQEAMEFAKRIMSMNEQSSNDHTDRVDFNFFHIPTLSDLPINETPNYDENNASNQMASTNDRLIPKIESNDRHFGDDREESANHLTNEGWSSVMRERMTNGRNERADSQTIVQTNGDRKIVTNGIDSEIVRTDYRRDHGRSGSPISCVSGRTTIEENSSQRITDDTPESSWKSRVIGRFLKMSKNDICNMLNNTSLRKFDIAMKHLVKQRKSSMSLGMRNNEGDKLKDAEASYNREEFMDQLSAMLDPSATVDLCNLPTQFIHHLSEVLQLDSTSDFEAALTPSAKVNPSVSSSKSVHPSMVKKSVAPSIVKKTVAPSIVEKSVAPSIVKKSVAPSIVKKSVAPSIVKKSVAPSTVAKIVAPALASRLVPRSVRKSVTTISQRQRPISRQTPMTMTTTTMTTTTTTAMTTMSPTTTNSPRRGPSSSSSSPQQPLHPSSTSKECVKSIDDPKNTKRPKDRQVANAVGTTAGGLTTIDLTTKSRRASRSSEEPVTSKLPIKRIVEESPKPTTATTTTMTSANRAARRRHHQSQIPDNTEASCGTSNGLASHENSGSLNLADLDDIFTAGIARAKKKVVHPSKSPKRTEMIEAQIHPRKNPENEGAFARDPNVDRAERAAVELDKIFSAGIVKAKMASIQALADVSRSHESTDNNRRNVEDPSTRTSTRHVADRQSTHQDCRSRHRTFARHATRCEKRNRRSAREIPDAFRNLTKEEWEARYGATSDSVYEKEYRAMVATMNRKNGRSPQNFRNELLPNDVDALNSNGRFVNRFAGESGLPETWTDSDDGRGSRNANPDASTNDRDRMRNDDESSDSSTSRSDGSDRPDDGDTLTRSSKFSKTREKMGKNVDSTQTERKRRRKGHKSRTKKSHRRRKDKKFKVRDRRKRDGKKKKRRSRRTNEETSSENDDTNDDETSESSRQRRSMLTEAEIKKEFNADVVVVVKEEPIDPGPRSKSAMTVRSADDSRPPSTSSASSMPAIVSTTTIVSSGTGQPTKTKAQLKQLPALPKNVDAAAMAFRDSSIVRHNRSKDVVEDNSNKIDGPTVVGCETIDPISTRMSNRSQATTMTEDDPLAKGGTKKLDIYAYKERAKIRTVRENEKVRPAHGNPCSLTQNLLDIPIEGKNLEKSSQVVKSVNGISGTVIDNSVNSSTAIKTPTKIATAKISKINATTSKSPMIGSATAKGQTIGTATAKNQIVGTAIAKSPMIVAETAKSPTVNTATAKGPTIGATIAKSQTIGAVIAKSPLIGTTTAKSPTVNTTTGNGPTIGAAIAKSQITDGAIAKSLTIATTTAKSSTIVTTAAKTPMISSTTAKGPVMSSTTAMNPMISTTTETSPIISTATGKSSVVSTTTAKTPVISAETAENPTIGPASAETSTISTTSAETSTISTMTAQTPTINTETTESPAISTATAETSTISATTPETSTISDTSPETPTISTTTAKTPMISTETAESPTISTATAEISSVSTESFETPTVSTTTSKTPTICTESAESSTITTETAKSPTITTETAESPIIGVASPEIPTISTTSAETSTISAATAKTPMITAETAETPMMSTASPETLTIGTTTAKTPTISAETAEAPTMSTTSPEDSTIVTTSAETSMIDTTSAETPKINTTSAETSTINTTSAEIPTINTTSAETSTISPMNVEASTLSATSHETLTICTTTSETSTISSTSSETSTISTISSETSTIGSTSSETSTIFTASPTTPTISTTNPVPSTNFDTNPEDSTTICTTSVTTSTIVDETDNIPAIDTSNAFTSQIDTTMVETPIINPTTTEIPTIVTSTIQTAITETPPIDDSPKPAISEINDTDQTSGSKSLTKKKIRPKSLTKITDTSSSIAEARMEAGKFAHIKSEGSKELKLREKLKKGRHRSTIDGLETTIPPMKPVRPRKRLISELVTVAEESTSSESNLRDSKIPKCCDYFKKGLASDGFPDLVPRETFLNFTDDCSTTNIIVEERSNVDCPDLPETSSWPFESSIVATITEEIDSGESSPFRGFTDQPILREDRVLTEAEITSEIEDFDSIPVAFETGTIDDADDVPTASTVVTLNDLKTTIVPLTVPIVYESDEFASGNVDVETSLLDFSLNDDLVDVATIVRSDDTVVDEIFQIPSQRRPSNDVITVATELPDDLPISHDSSAIEMNQSETIGTIESSVLVAQTEVDSNVAPTFVVCLPSSDPVKKNVNTNRDVAPIIATSLVTSDNENENTKHASTNVDVESMCSQISGNVDDTKISCKMEITELRTDCEIATAEIRTIEEDEKPDVDEKNTKECGSTDSSTTKTTIAIVTSIAGSSSVRDVVEDRTNDVVTDKKRETSEKSREIEKKVKNDGRRVRAKCRDRIREIRTKKSMRRHHDHRRGTKKKSCVTEKMVDQAVTSKIVKLIGKPTSKQIVSARMLEIDFEIHKLMNEKMMLYKMLENDDFTSLDDKGKTAESTNDPETKTHSDTDENGDIAEPEVATSRLDRDDDRDELAERATNREDCPKKSAAKINETENDVEKRKRRKTTKSDVKKRTRDARSEEDGERRSIPESNVQDENTDIVEPEVATSRLDRDDDRDELAERATNREDCPKKSAAKINETKNDVEKRKRRKTTKSDVKKRTRDARSEEGGERRSIPESNVQDENTDIVEPEVATSRLDHDDDRDELAERATNREDCPKKSSAKINETENDDEKRKRRKSTKSDAKKRTRDARSEEDGERRSIPESNVQDENTDIVEPEVATSRLDHDDDRDELAERATNREDCPKKSSAKINETENDDEKRKRRKSTKSDAKKRTRDARSEEDGERRSIPESNVRDKNTDTVEPEVSTLRLDHDDDRDELAERATNREDCPKKSSAKTNETENDVEKKKRRKTTKSDAKKRTRDARSEEDGERRSIPESNVRDENTDIVEPEVSTLRLDHDDDRDELAERATNREDCLKKSAAKINETENVDEKRKRRKTTKSDAKKRMRDARSEEDGERRSIPESNVRDENTDIVEPAVATSRLDHDDDRDELAERDTNREDCAKKSAAKINETENDDEKRKRRKTTKSDVKKRTRDATSEEDGERRSIPESNVQDENTDIVEPAVATSRLDHDDDRDELAERATNREDCPKKSAAKINETENDDEKRKRRKTTKSNAKKRTRDAGSEEDGERRSIPESNVRHERSTSVESSRNESAPTLSREKSLSSTEIDDPEDKKNHGRKTKMSRIREPRRSAIKHRRENSSKEEQRERSHDSTDRSTKLPIPESDVTPRRSKKRGITKNVEEKKTTKSDKSKTKSTKVVTKKSMKKSRNDVKTIENLEPDLSGSDDSTWDSVDNETIGKDDREGKKNKGLAMLEQSFKRETARAKKHGSLNAIKIVRQDSSGSTSSTFDDEKSIADGETDEKSVDPTIDDTSKVSKHVTNVIDAVAENCIDRLYDDETILQTDDSIVEETTRIDDESGEIGMETSKKIETSNKSSVDESPESRRSEDRQISEKSARRSTAEIEETAEASNRDDREDRENTDPTEETNSDDDDRRKSSIDDISKTEDRPELAKIADERSSEISDIEDTDRNIAKKYTKLLEETFVDDEDDANEEKKSTKKKLFAASDSSESVGNPEKSVANEKSTGSRVSSPDIPLAELITTDEDISVRNEQPKDRIDDEKSSQRSAKNHEKLATIAKENRRDKDFENDGSRNKIQNGRSKKDRHSSSRKKRNNEIDDDNFPKDDDSDDRTERSRSKSGTKRKSEKTHNSNRKRSRHSNETTKKSRRRKNEKSASRDDSSGEKESPTRRKNRSTSSVTPTTSSTRDRDTSTRRSRKRKRRSELTMDEMIGCKVLLIDCKYTYLNPNMHPKILKKLGISKINPREQTIVRSADRSAPISTRIEAAASNDESIGSPIERSSSPIERSSSPIERSSSPIERSSSPIESPSLPIMSRSSPVNVPPSPEPAAPTSDDLVTSPIPISSTSDDVLTSTIPIPSTSDDLSTSTIPISSTSDDLATLPIPISSTPKEICDRPNVDDDDDDEDDDDDDVSDENIQIVKVADENLPTASPSEDEEEDVVGDVVADPKNVEENVENVDEDAKNVDEDMENVDEDQENTENAENVEEDAENVDEDVENVDEDVENVDEDVENVNEDVENVDEDVENVDEDVENVDEDVENVASVVVDVEEDVDLVQEADDVADVVEESAATPDTADDVVVLNVDDANKSTNDKKSATKNNDPIAESVNKIRVNNESNAKRSSPVSETDHEQEIEITRTRYTVHKGPILDIKVLDDSFLAASEDGSIYRYSQKSNGILNIYKGHEAAVTCIHVIEQRGKFWKLYSGSLDGTFRCYDITTGAQDRPPANVGSPVQCMDQAWGVIFVGTKSGHISRYNIKSGGIKGDRLEFSDKSVLALKASAEGPRKVLIVASRNQPITIRDALSGLFLRTICGYKNHTVYSLMRERNLVYCGTSSTSIPVFDFTNGEQVAQYNAGVGIVCMRLYRQILFAGCYDGNIYVFDTKETKLICSIPGPGNMLLSMEIVDDEIIAGSKNRQLHSWRMPRQVRALLSERT